MSLYLKNVPLFEFHRHPVPVMNGFSFLFWRKERSPQSEVTAPPDLRNRFNRTYQALSSASVDTLWQMLIDLADMSWHPLISSTNAPRGLTAKPGLIYRAMPRCFPVMPMRVFVERVSPQKLLSVRLFPIPGLEERVTYHLESTVWGTRISYSITLKGWLSPVVWSVVKPHAAQVAAAIAMAAEQTAAKAIPTPQSKSEAW